MGCSAKTSDICTDCGASPQDVRHLFACKTHPTDLTTGTMTDFTTYLAVANNSNNMSSKFAIYAHHSFTFKPYSITHCFTCFIYFHVFTSLLATRHTTSAYETLPDSSITGTPSFPRTAYVTPCTQLLITFLIR